MYTYVEFENCVRCLVRVSVPTRLRTYAYVRLFYGLCLIIIYVIMALNCLQLQITQTTHLLRTPTKHLASRHWRAFKQNMKLSSSVPRTHCFLGYL